MPVEKGPDCVGDEMHRWKHTGLHSGTGKKGKKGKLVAYPKGRQQAIAIALSKCGKSKYAEQLEGLGYSEEAAAAVERVYDFVTAKQVEEEVDKSYTSDIDSTPGKQRGSSGRRKQPQQESQATFPTLPKQGYSEAKDPTGKCDQEQIKKQNQANRTPEERQADQQRAREMQGQKPDVPSGVREEAAKKAAETRKKCSKNKDHTTQNNAVTTPTNNATSAPRFKEMHQSISEKRQRIKQLQSEGHPASILIKQVRDHS